MALSYSQLQTYRRCPRQYEYAFVKKVPRPISRGESYGSSIHNALRRFGMLEMEYAAPAGKKQLTLFTEDHSHHTRPELSATTLLSFWRECFIAEGYESRAAMDSAFESGKQALTHFFGWWQQKERRVLAVEKGFSLPVPETGVRIGGRFDRVERTPQGLSVIDFKSTGPRSEESLRTDLQLSLYALAAADLWKESVASLSILSVTESGITEQATTRTKAELADAAKAIRILHERMQSGDVTATPSVSTCRHCPYRNLCPARSV